MKSSEQNPQNPWGGRSFADIVRQEDPIEEFRHYYTGDDNKEKFSGVYELFNGHNLTDDCIPSSGSRWEISKERYLSLLKPWRGASIIKLLGKSISYKVMLQRTQSLWNLPKGFELIDLEGGFFVVRFFSQEYYFHVLERGPG